MEFAIWIFGLRGFTLIEILIGTALALIIFSGIFGAYRVGLKVVGQNKARVSAIALADEQMETIRNLSYADAGTYSCKEEYPDCSLTQPTTIIQGYPYGKVKNSFQRSINNVLYTITTKIDYTVDSFDGVASPADVCPNDYKKIKVNVSWGGRFPGEVPLDTIISPANTSQECDETGGVLKITIFNASGEAVAFPDIKVTNIHTGLVKTAQPENGVAYISLPADTSAYRIEASKDGYSFERTYAVGEIYDGQTISTPTKPNATLLEGKLTEASLSIDKLSSLTVNSHAEGASASFMDSFFDASQIVEFSHVAVSGGAAKLAKTDSIHYYPSGYIISQTIEPAALISWNELNYTDNTPSNTLIRYQVLYLSGADWILVPDSDLPGNSAGLQHPPISLSRLARETYPKIRLKATLLSQGNLRKTPIIYDWTATWFGSNPTIINDVVFNLQGGKTVGKTSSNKQIYKYSQNKQTSSGAITISDLEWDSYSFSVDKSATGFDLTRTDPIQPLSLAPDSSQTAELFLKAENSLLVLAKDNSTAQPIFSANIRIYNASLNYDQSLLTDEAGLAYFLPLSAGTYSLEITADGYQNYASTISVSGSTNKIVNLILP